MKFTHLLTIAFFFLSLNLHAQISDDQAQQIDALFTDWTEADHPGGVVGIMQGGEMIYTKAYGLASLEYQVPNKVGTIFNTGSVSKQFTAMGIVLLHQQGLLSVDDDIRKHLTDLPDFGHTITIRHMLHHTSGMRSLHAMLGLAGWRSDDSRTNEDLYRFMLNQKELNFIPGEEYLYCNTGYMLMKDIMEKVTGEPFPQWMKANVFEPLGMPNTYVEDRYDRVVPNNATSYYQQGDELFRAIEYWGYVGSGNMHSTVEDLLTWSKHFYQSDPEWDAAFEMLQTVDKLNDGSPNNYAFGVNVDEVMGYKRVQHGGSVGGFRAYASTYPEEELNIAILTNYSAANPRGKESEIAEILIDEKQMIGVITTADKEAPVTYELTNDQLKYFVASYWNDRDNFARKLYVSQDTLRYWRSEDSETPLVPVAVNTFKMVGVGAEVFVKFDMDENGNKVMSVIEGEARPTQFIPFTPLEFPEQLYPDYSGRFYSPELESTFDVVTDGERLMGHHARHGDFPLFMLKKDVLELPGYFVIKYQRDANDAITGVRISNGRARNVWFEKQ